MISRRTTGTRGVRYTSGVLTIVALLLGVVALQNASSPLGTAHAADRQGGAPEGLMAFNAADQRARMIAALQKIEERLGAIETRFSAGPLPVKVVEIPQPGASQTRASGSGASGEASNP